MCHLSLRHFGLHETGHEEGVPPFMNVPLENRFSASNWNSTRCVPTSTASADRTSAFWRGSMRLS